MEQLQVTARLFGAIALPDGPIAIDGLLAAAVARREALPPPMPGALLRIEIPVQREPGGRFHLASLGEAEFEMFERRFVNRRFPLPEAQAIGEPKLRRILLSGGPSKNYRIPMETGHLRDDLITWWCVGDREEIGDLLPHVSHLGKRRAVGLGRVREWRVDPCEAWPGFPVVRDGRALRPLPTDWPGLDQPALAYRTLTYPYWERAREELCAVP